MDPSHFQKAVRNSVPIVDGRFEVSLNNSPTFTHKVSTAMLQTVHKTEPREFHSAKVGTFDRLATVAASRSTLPATSN